MSLIIWGQNKILYILKNVHTKTTFMFEQMLLEFKQIVERVWIHVVSVWTNVVGVWTNIVRVWTNVVRAWINIVGVRTNIDTSLILLKKKIFILSFLNW